MSPLQAKRPWLNTIILLYLEKNVTQVYRFYNLYRIKMSQSCTKACNVITKVFSRMWLKQVLGGMEIVALSISSHEQTQ